jgi:hypothetical protein
LIPNGFLWTDVERNRPEEFAKALQRTPESLLAARLEWERFTVYQNLFHGSGTTSSILTCIFRDSATLGDYWEVTICHEETGTKTQVAEFVSAGSKKDYMGIPRVEMG